MAITPDPLIKASKLPIIVGILYVLLHFSFVYFPNAFIVIQVPALTAIGTVLALLSPFFFILVFGWAGWRAGREFKMGIIDSGSVSALSYVVVASISIVMTIAFLLSPPAVFHLIHGPAASSDYLEPDEVKIAGSGLIVALIAFSASQLFFGAMINFGIGCVAASLAKRIK